MSMPTLTSDQLRHMLGRCRRHLPVFAPVHPPGPRALGLVGFVEVTAFEGDPYLPAGERYLLLQFGGVSGGPAPVVK